MRRDEFVLGLARLAAATKHSLDDLTVEVYAEALGPQFNADDWNSFTRNAVAAGLFRWFPTVAEILDQIHGKLDLEAQVAYDRVLNSAAYTPEGGAHWSGRRIEELCGKAAVEAWLAAGAHEAFATTWKADDRRKAFLEAYRRAAREAPERRLTPAPELKQLGTGVQTPQNPSDAEARQLLARIAKHEPAR